jgi:hypothetical protein
MAIINTRNSIGWYGNSSSSCASFDLASQIGTFSYENGTFAFVPGSLGLSLFEAKSLVVFGMENGEVKSWTLDSEKAKYEKSGSLKSGYSVPLSELECGKIYLIQNPRNLQLMIPNFIPSSVDVDMGKVVA